MKYYTYILHSASSNKYYIGHTNNITRRLEEHNRTKGKFTDKGQPWKLVYKEEFITKADAHKREMEIKKKKSRKYIEFIISL